MDSEGTSRLRVTLDGKFFRLGQKKFFVKGVTYGPFAPGPDGEPFASPEVTAADFALIRELGANLLRVYTVPSLWFLDLARRSELKVLIDIHWSKHVCFLDSQKERDAALAAVRQAVKACAGHPSVFAYSVVNEIPPDIVRWSGARAIESFLDSLVDAAKEIDPECLCTFANFPPTEFLQPRNIDFISFNIYLHHQRPFENYLARLQMQAYDKPLIIGEHGNYSKSEYEQTKYPRYEFFKQVTDVFRKDGRTAPVFNDKHLSWKWEWAREMVDISHELNFAFTAGSSLPVTWRMPAIEMPDGAEVEELFGVATGSIDSYDFHILEMIQ